MVRFSSILFLFSTRFQVGFSNEARSVCRRNDSKSFVPKRHRMIHKKLLLRIGISELKQPDVYQLQRTEANGFHFFEALLTEVLYHWKNIFKGLN